MKVEWDPAKAASNLRKHGVSFEEAWTALTDRRGKREYDTAHSGDEDRYAWIAVSSRNRPLAIIYTRRHEAFRIISARLATKAETERYLAES